VDLSLISNIATILSFFVAVISLLISYYATREVDKLKIKIGMQTNLINPNIENFYMSIKEEVVKQ